MTSSYRLFSETNILPEKKKKKKKFLGGFERKRNLGFYNDSAVRDLQR